jgi:hypothetical protein
VANTLNLFRQGAVGFIETQHQRPRDQEMMFACFKLLGGIRANLLMLHLVCREQRRFRYEAGYGHARSGLLDRCTLGVHQLPAPVLPNEDAGPAALLVDRSILVFSLGGGAIGHDGGIP